MKANRAHFLINGFNGRMGQSLIRLLAQKNTHHYSNFKDFDPSHRHAIVQPSAIIDFSDPGDLEKVLLNDYQIPLVSGTTNLDNRHIDLANKYSEAAPVMLASNFSYGVQTLSSSILNFIAENPGITDCDITEVHHTKKKDSPSGTAKSISSEILELNPKIRINYISLRNHDVFGLHRISFFSSEKNVTFQHQAFSRDIFAKGAIAAALWLKDQPNGLHSFNKFFRNNL